VLPQAIQWAALEIHFRSHRRRFGFLLRDRHRVGLRVGFEVGDPDAIFGCFTSSVRSRARVALYFRRARADFTGTTPQLP
jgi:hypothetical protein